MKKISFLCEGNGIGITAPSDGNSKQTDLVRLENGKMNLEERGYRVKETASVRMSKRGRSAEKQVRADEFMSLIADPEINWIVCAKGGDFLLEILPYLDLELIRKNPKWIQGYSDNTGILYPVTTLCDIPTVYGCNFNDFGMAQWHPALTANLELLEGRRLEENSFSFYEAEFPERLTGLECYDTKEPVCLRPLHGEETLAMSGRLLGGCMDLLLNLIGTPYEGTKEFNRRYAKDGVLWYLETFALSAERLTTGLLQMKYAGWFERAIGFLFGRPCFFQSDYGIGFEEAVESALGDLKLPILTGADIGHRAPQMTMINGWKAEFTYQEERGKLRYLPEE